MLAEPAGQGLGCDGPCGRTAGEERAGARVPGVRGGCVELGADEGGEPGGRRTGTVSSRRHVSRPCYSTSAALLHTRAAVHRSSIGWSPRQRETQASIRSLRPKAVAAGDLNPYSAPLSHEV